MRSQFKKSWKHAEEACYCAIFTILKSIPWTMTHKSSKPEKRLQTIQACLLINLFALIHYVPQCKICGTQEKARGRNSVSRRAFPPTMPYWDGAGHARGLGIHLLCPLLRTRGWAGWVKSPYIPMEHTPSGGFTQSHFISIHNRVKRAIKTGKFFVCLF